MHVKSRALAAAAIALASAGGAALCGCSHRSGAAIGPSPTPAPITTGDFPAYGHAPDYTWIAGKFEPSLTGGACSYVIFSAMAHAPWGGRIAIEAHEGMLSGIAGGEMVVVHGDFDRALHARCGAVAYAARRIEAH